MPYGFKMFLHAICADFLRAAICPYRTVFQDEVFKISKKVLRNYIFIETTYDIFIALPLLGSVIKRQPWPGKNSQKSVG